METANKEPEIEANFEGDVSTMAGNYNFRVAIKKGNLAATPTIQRKIFYFEWSIVTEPIKIDGPWESEYSRDDDTTPDSMENGDDEGLE
jgi:hypothetical protein